MKINQNAQMDCAFDDCILNASFHESDIFRKASRVTCLVLFVNITVKFIVAPIKIQQ